MVIVVETLISLVTPVPIAQDQVETTTCTIFTAVLKASKVVEHSTCKHFTGHGLSRKYKDYGAQSVVTHQI